MEKQNKKTLKDKIVTKMIAEGLAICGTICLIGGPAYSLRTKDYVTSYLRENPQVEVYGTLEQGLKNCKINTKDYDFMSEQLKKIRGEYPDTPIKYKELYDHASRRFFTGLTVGSLILPFGLMALYLSKDRRYLFEDFNSISK